MITTTPFAIIESGIRHSQDIMCLLIFLTIVNEVCFTWSLCSSGYCFCSPQQQRKCTEQQISPWACPPTHLPKAVQDWATPKKWSQISPSWHTEYVHCVCDTSRLRQGGVPRPQERCQCLSASSPPQPQHWAFVKALAHVMSRCSKIPEYSSIPLVSLERCHHKKNLEQDNFFAVDFLLCPLMGLKSTYLKVCSFILSFFII